MYSSYTVQLGGNVIVQQDSTDGGHVFSQPTTVAVVGNTGQVDPVQGGFTIDGMAGSRTSTYPSFDTARPAGRVPATRSCSPGPTCGWG